jgi:hypothetical protein
MADTKPNTEIERFCCPSFCSKMKIFPEERDEDESEGENEDWVRRDGS